MLRVSTTILKLISYNEVLNVRVLFYVAILYDIVRNRMTCVFILSDIVNNISKHVTNNIRMCNAS